MDRRRGDRGDARRGPDRQLRPRRAGRPRRASSAGSSRAGSPGSRSTSSRRSRSPSIRCSSATTSSSPRISAPRPPRPRTGPGSSPPSRCARRSPAAWSPTPSTSPPSGRRRWRRWRRSCPCARSSAGWPRGSATGRVDRVEVSFRGRIAEHDTRLLGIAVLVGILSGHTEEPVNLVNAPTMAEDRGIELIELKESASEDFTELVTVRIGGVEVAGTGVGPRNVPYLVGVWGQSFYMPFADHLAIFRYVDQPGMIGRVGTAFGEHGVNIVSAAVGAEASGDGGGDGADHRRRRPGRGRSTRSSPATPSRSGARSASSASRLGWADARGGDHPPRGARGAAGRGAARPAGRPRRGAGRGPRRRDQLRRPDGALRRLPGRAARRPAWSATRSPARSRASATGSSRTRSATG